MNGIRKIDKNRRWSFVVGRWPLKILPDSLNVSVLWSATGVVSQRFVNRVVEHWQEKCYECRMRKHGTCLRWGLGQRLPTPLLRSRCQLADRGNEGVRGASQSAVAAVGYAQLPPEFFAFDGDQLDASGEDLVAGEAGADD